MKKTPLLSLWELNGSSLNKINSHSPKDALCQVWLKLAQWFRRGRFLNFVNVFSLFRNYLHFEKVGALHLKKLEYSSLKDSLCKVWLKLAQWFWRGRFFKFIQCISLFRNYLPLENCRALPLYKVDPLYSRMLCTKFGWYWLRGSGEEDFLISSMYFRYFVIIYPWKRAGPFIWTNLNPL